MSIILGLLIIDFCQPENSDNSFDNDKGLKLSIVEFPEDKPKKPELPKPKIEPKRAQIKYTNQIKIVDDKRKTDMPDKTEIDNSLVPVKTIEGISTDAIVETSNNMNNDSEITEAGN